MRLRGLGLPAQAHGPFGPALPPERAELLGGTVHLTSRQGAGTTVTIAIPRRSGGRR